jgi:predicted RNA-binding Zn-ribbon protein involved in translation (DUF1610 family)
LEFEAWSDLRIPYALDEESKMVEPHKANKDSAYRCPECGQELILRVGTVRATHFSHRKGEGQCVFDGAEWEQYARKHRAILREAKEHELRPVEESSKANAPESIFPPEVPQRREPAIVSGQEESATAAEPVPMMQEYRRSCPSDMGLGDEEYSFPLIFFRLRLKMHS